MKRVHVAVCPSLATLTLAALALAAPLASPLAAGPTVVPTSEGQLGMMPSAGDAVIGPNFVGLSNSRSILGRLDRDAAGNFTINFFLDDLHTGPSPVQIDAFTAIYNDVLDRAPTGSTRTSTVNGDEIAGFSFSSDGSSPSTMKVTMPIYDENGTVLTTVTIDDIPTFPDPSINDTGVAVDNQGRVTVAYTELPGGVARVRGQRFDAAGVPIGGAFTISPDGHAATDVALLDPAGNRLLVPFSRFDAIRGSIVDTSGPTPVVGPSIPISTTPATFANLAPIVASAVELGRSIVVWENLSGLQGNPVDIYARRFDAMGNPVGDDFRVNTTTADAQGQPAAAMDPSGATAVVWAGDPLVPGQELDVFLQVYGPDGQPIGPETVVNTGVAGIQDRPAVMFLPEPDAQGRPQFVVAWRDVAAADGSTPNGTGTSYKCFSIDGIDDPTEIFADGFESGDTSSWSTTQN